MKRIKMKRWVKIVIFIIFIITFTCLYSRYIEPKLFKVKEYTIIDSSIPDSFYGFKIVQISDIHYKTTINKEELTNIIEEINLLKPDIVILCGDLFDKSITYTDEDYNDLKELLGSINYNVGKFAIKGDHDLDSHWEEIIEYSSFTDLNDNYKYIYNKSTDPILLIGISSNYYNNHIKDTFDKINILDDYYSILILHEPDFISYIDYSKIDLILAGHSLNGQIRLPLIGGLKKEKFSKSYYDEYYELGNTKLYITNGIGTGKFKFRFLNIPSINIFRLRNK